MADAFAEIQARIDRWSDGVRGEALEALQQTADEGADGVREIIHAKETDWGRERQAGMHGPPRPYAGRIEDGDMIGDVDSTLVDDIGEDLYEVRWGWADPEEYYLIQEHGFKEYETRIAPMESLNTTLSIAEDSLKSRLDNLGIRNA